MIMKKMISVTPPKVTSLHEINLKPRKVVLTSKNMDGAAWVRLNRERLDKYFSSPLGAFKQKASAGAKKYWQGIKDFPTEFGLYVLYQMTVVALAPQAVGYGGALLANIFYAKFCEANKYNADSFWDYKHFIGTVQNGKGDSFVTEIHFKDNDLKGVFYSGVSANPVSKKTIPASITKILGDKTSGIYYDVNKQKLRISYAADFKDVQKVLVYIDEQIASIDNGVAGYSPGRARQLKGHLLSIRFAIVDKATLSRSGSATREQAEVWPVKVPNHIASSIVAMPGITVNGNVLEIDKNLKYDNFLLLIADLRSLTSTMSEKNRLQLIEKVKIAYKITHTYYNPDVQGKNYASGKDAIAPWDRANTVTFKPINQDTDAYTFNLQMQGSYYQMGTTPMNISHIANKDSGDGYYAGTWGEIAVQRRAEARKNVLGKVLAGKIPAGINDHMLLLGLADPQHFGSEADKVLMESLVDAFPADALGRREMGILLSRMKVLLDNTDRLGKGNLFFEKPANWWKHWIKLYSKGEKVVLNGSAGLEEIKLEDAIAKLLKEKNYKDYTVTPAQIKNFIQTYQANLQIEERKPEIAKLVRELQFTRGAFSASKQNDLIKLLVPQYGISESEAKTLVTEYVKNIDEIEEITNNLISYQDGYNEPFWSRMTNCGTDHLGFEEFLKVARLSRFFPSVVGTEYRRVKTQSVDDDSIDATIYGGNAGIQGSMQSLNPITARGSKFNNGIKAEFSLASQDFYRRKYANAMVDEKKNNAHPSMAKVGTTEEALIMQATKNIDEAVDPVFQRFLNNTSFAFIASEQARLESSNPNFAKLSPDQQYWFIYEKAIESFKADIDAIGFIEPSLKRIITDLIQDHFDYHLYDVMGEVFIINKLTAQLEVMDGMSLYGKAKRTMWGSAGAPSDVSRFEATIQSREKTYRELYSKINGKETIVNPTIDEKLNVLLRNLLEAGVNLGDGKALLDEISKNGLESAVYLREYGSRNGFFGYEQAAKWLMPVLDSIVNLKNGQDYGIYNMADVINIGAETELGGEENKKSFGKSKHIFMKYEDVALYFQELLDDGELQDNADVIKKRLTDITEMLKVEAELKNDLMIMLEKKYGMSRDMVYQLVYNVLFKEGNGPNLILQGVENIDLISGTTKYDAASKTLHLSKSDFIEAWHKTEFGENKAATYQKFSKVFAHIAKDISVPTRVKPKDDNIKDHSIFYIFRFNRNQKKYGPKADCINQAVTGSIPAETTQMFIKKIIGEFRKHNLELSDLSNGAAFSSNITFKSIWENMKQDQMLSTTGQRFDKMPWRGAAYDFNAEIERWVDFMDNISAPASLFLSTNSDTVDVKRNDVDMINKIFQQVGDMYLKDMTTSTGSTEESLANINRVLHANPTMAELTKPLTFSIFDRDNNLYKKWAETVIYTWMRTPDQYINQETFHKQGDQDLSADPLNFASEGQRNDMMDASKGGIHYVEGLLGLVPGTGCGSLYWAQNIHRSLKAQLRFIVPATEAVVPALSKYLLFNQAPTASSALAHSVLSTLLFASVGFSTSSIIAASVLGYILYTYASEGFRNRFINRYKAQQAKRLKEFASINQSFDFTNAASQIEDYMQIVNFFISNMPMISSKLPSEAFITEPEANKLVNIFSQAARWYTAKLELMETMALCHSLMKKLAERDNLSPEVFKERIQFFHDQIGINLYPNTALFTQKYLPGMLYFTLLGGSTFAFTFGAFSLWGSFLGWNIMNSLVASIVTTTAISIGRYNSLKYILGNHRRDIGQDVEDSASALSRFYTQTLVLIPKVVDIYTSYVKASFKISYSDSFPERTPFKDMILGWRDVADYWGNGAKTKMSDVVMEFGEGKERLWARYFNKKDIKEAQPSQKFSDEIRLNKFGRDVANKRIFLAENKISTPEIKALIKLGFVKALDKKGGQTVYELTDKWPKIKRNFIKKAVAHSAISEVRAQQIYQWLKGISLNEYQLNNFNTTVSKDRVFTIDAEISSAEIKELGKLGLIQDISPADVKRLNLTNGYSLTDKWPKYNDAISAKEKFGTMVSAGGVISADRAEKIFVWIETNAGKGAAKSIGNIWNSFNSNYTIGDKFRGRKTTYQLKQERFVMALNMLQASMPAVAFWSLQAWLATSLFLAASPLTALMFAASIIGMLTHIYADTYTAKAFALPKNISKAYKKAMIAAKLMKPEAITPPLITPQQLSGANTEIGPRAKKIAKTSKWVQKVGLTVGLGTGATTVGMVGVAAPLYLIGAGLLFFASRTYFENYATIKEYYNNLSDAEYKKNEE